MDHFNFTPILTEDQIQERIKELGEQITKDMAGKDVLAVCVLKGSFMFYADLIRNINMDFGCEFMGAASYGLSTKSSGEVRMTLDFAQPVKNRHVLLIEDIIDTGLTIKYLQNVIQSRGPASISTATLLLKPEAKVVDYPVDYVGFEIGNDFVVGYGLDYQGLYRNLPYIGQVRNLN